MNFYFVKNNNILKGNYRIYEDESIIFEPLPEFNDTIELNDIAYELCINTEKKKIMTFMGYQFGFINKKFTLPKIESKGEIYYDGTYDRERFQSIIPCGIFREDGWYCVGEQTENSKTYMVAQDTLISLKNDDIVTIYFKIN